MPKFEVRLTTEARQQLQDIARYRRLQVGTASAKKITNKILAELRKLGDFPKLGVTPSSVYLEKAGYRMLIVGEYLCFYNKDGNTLWVNQIFHGSADYVKFLIK